MNLIFICLSTDNRNFIVNDTLDRIFYLSQNNKINSVQVISLKENGIMYKNNIKVFGLNNKYRSRIIKFFKFYYIIYKLLKRNKVDYIYLYMSPTVAILVFPFKFFFNVKIVSWFGHTRYNFITKLSLKYFTDIWLNAIKSFAPFKTKNIYFVGQGVRKDIFYPNYQIEKEFDFITVGRISPIKQLLETVRYIDMYSKNYHKKITLLICGDAFTNSDQIYKNKLLNLISEKNLDKQVTITGMLNREELISKLWTSKIFFFLVPGGIGKASLEAMACGMPMIMPSPESKNFFDDKISKYIICNRDDKSILNLMNKNLSLNKDEYISINKIIRKSFENKYSLESFTNRIVNILVNK